MNHRVTAPATSPTASSLPALGLALACVALAWSLAAGALGDAPTDAERAAGGRRWIAEGYDESTGLVREGAWRSDAPYWLNDNVFAYGALAGGNETERALAGRIRSSLEDYGALLGLPRHEGGTPYLGFHEAVLGYPVALPMPCPRTFILERVDEGWELRFTVRDPGYVLPSEPADAGDVVGPFRVRANPALSPTCVEDLDNYPDLLLYAALTRWAEGRAEEAKGFFAQARDLWDGTGFDYRKNWSPDALTTHTWTSYQCDWASASPTTPMNLSQCPKVEHTSVASQNHATYKLALFLLAERRLGESWPLRDAALDLLRATQPGLGGFRTEYQISSSLGFVNVETTALAVMAMQPDVASPPAGPSEGRLWGLGPVWPLVLLTLLVGAGYGAVLWGTLRPPHP